MRGCDTVFHVAAKVDFWGKYEDFHRVNVVGTENTLKAAKAAGVRSLVYVSAGAVVVGDKPVIDADETWPIPKRPYGAYAATKAMAETTVLAADSPDMKTVAVRPPAIWGKDDPFFLPELVAGVKKGFFVWVNGGRYPMVACNVANVCEGTILAAERGRGGEVYFLTDGDQMEFRTFISDLLGTQGIEPPKLSVPYWTAWVGATVLEGIWRVLRLGGSPPITREVVKLIGGPLTVTDAKAREELGYSSSMSWAQGLAEINKIMD